MQRNHYAPKGPAWQVLILWLLVCWPAGAVSLSGRLLDAHSDQPIAGATVMLDSVSTLTDPLGDFSLTGEGQQVRMRAVGYGRLNWPLPQNESTPLEFKLQPLQPKALYLTVYGIGDKHLREAALQLIRSTELNALVIDVKGDRGLIPYPSKVPEALSNGARRVTTVPNPIELIAKLKAENIYLIARIVVFKDELLATAHPEWAVRRTSGGPFRDREGFLWLDASRRETWGYSIAVAREAAQLGFDEIQFDYVRFPDARGLVFSQTNNQANRVAAINGFLQEAKRQLAPYNVFVAADIFGYVPWNSNDTLIGQHLESLAAAVDYLSPMLYPSGFQFGIPGYRQPVANVGPIVARSLANAGKRTGLPGAHWRPWLQAFRDYAFDRRVFGATEIRAQIDAAEQFGSNGWMLWNAQNRYSRAGLKDQPAPPPSTEVAP